MAIADQALVSGTRFLTSILIGRMCGQEELGVYALTFAAYLLFACAQESLITSPYTVFCTRLQSDARRKLAGSVLLHSLCLSLSAALMLSLGACLLLTLHGSTSLLPAALTLAATLPCLLLWEFGRRYAIAHLKLYQALVFDAVTCLLQITGLAWFVWQDKLSFVSGFLALAFGCACTSVFCLFYFREHFQPRWSRVKTDWARHWKFGRWVWSGQIVDLLHGYVPAWILVLALGTAATGIFSACENIVLLSNPLLLAIANLVAATSAHARTAGGYLAVRRVIQSAAITSFGAMGLLWVILLFYGERVLTFVYSAQFSGYGHVVGIIATGAPLWALSRVISIGLRTLEVPASEFRGKVAGLLTTTILSILLVLPFGIAGVAYAVVAGCAVSTLWQALVFYRLAPLPDRAASAGAE